MKKFRLPILIVIVFVCIFVIALVFNSKTTIKIEAYGADIYIDEYGAIDVSESWVIKYPSGYNVRFRDINYQKDHLHNPLTQGLDTHNDKASFDNASASVEVIDLDTGQVITNGIREGYSFNGDRDERGQRITCEPYSDECESIFVDLTSYGGMGGRKQFTYTYRINGAVTQYDDISELNWILFDMMEAKIKKAYVHIHLPSNSYSKDDILVWGHSSSSGNISITSNQDIDISAKNISKDDKLEIRVVVPNDLFSNISPNNVVKGELKEKIISYEGELSRITNLQVAFVWIINILTIIVIALTVFMIIRVYKKYDKEYDPIFKGETLSEPPSDISPAEMSYLYYFGSPQNEDITATLLDLVHRKVLLLKDKGYEITSKNPDFDIELNTDADLNKLEDHERILIDMLINTIGNGKSVNTQEIKNYGNSYSKAQKLMNKCNEFVNCIKREYKNKKYFENAREKAMSKNGAFALLHIVSIVLCFILSLLFNISTIVNIIIIFALLVSYITYLTLIKRRTRAGNEEYVKWKAFKKFLESFGSFKDYPMPSIVIWEKYLVYATSLKVADKVMEQLEIALPETDELNASSDATFMRWYYFGPTYRFNTFVVITNSFNQARSNSMSTISAHNMSSSGGHGGGFSGGSSFGGGGGGGRSR